VLRSKELKSAFVTVGAGLKAGWEKLRKVNMYPVPILTRDIPDTASLSIPTVFERDDVQFYLPRQFHAAHRHDLHEVLPNGRKPKKAQMPFSPNTGYAFAVADNTGIGRPVGPGENARQILLTYFVDAGPWRFVRIAGVGWRILCSTRRAI